MSISYNKSVPVVFLVQEGDELPRAATTEDFLKAGFVPAARTWEPAPTAAQEDEPATTATPTPTEESKDEDCPLTCEDCLFLGEDHILVELVTLPKLIGDTIGDVFKDVKKTINLDGILEGHLDGILDPFKFAEGTNRTEKKPASKEKSSPVEDFAGDLFAGAFSVFNTVKGGLSGLLDPVEFPEPTQPAKASPAESKASPDLGASFPNLKSEWNAESNDSSSETPEAEPVKEEVPAEEEKPEFSVFEQTVIKQFEELGLGEDAKSALRKSKEFSDFLVSKQPTPEQAKAFADMLKNGKPPFFG